jgi:hypothetical protein
MVIKARVVFDGEIIGLHNIRDLTHDLSPIGLMDIKQDAIIRIENGLGFFRG